MKSIYELKPDGSPAMDLRGEPIDICPCGCTVWNLKVMWENGELAMFFYDMECACCGSIATAPQFID